MTNASTMRLMVGALTCSSAASAASEIGPANTMTESAESLGALIPAAPSSRRAMRSRRIAAP
jgi:hypothetical protein